MAIALLQASLLGNPGTEIARRRPVVVALAASSETCSYSASDFRSVYAAVLGDWFGADNSKVLQGRFAPAPVLRAARTTA